jgi:hypothetical protein
VIVCKLRSLLNSLAALSISPRISLTPGKSLFENLWRNKQGNCRCKMAGAGFHSIAKLHAPRIANRKMGAPRIATVKNINLKGDCHRPELAAANLCDLRTELGNPQYTLPRGYSSSGKPRYMSAVCHNRVNSSTSYSTSGFPMIAAPYLFYAKLYKCKTYTLRNV